MFPKHSPAAIIVLSLLGCDSIGFIKGNVGKHGDRVRNETCYSDEHSDHWG